ncbi:MAG: GEVED domain-containing protein [Chitinophagaceae bacterium]
MKKNYIYFLLLITATIIGITKSNAQTCTPDPNGCTDYSNAFLNSTTAGTLEYDNLVSTFHATGARRSDGTWMVWGETIANDGISNVLVPQPINVANYPTLTGNVLKFTASSIGPGNGQYILLTTTGLFVWGRANGLSILSSTFTPSTAFQKLTVNGQTNGLPTGVTPSQIKMMFATNRALAIVTCSGAGYVLTQTQAMQGDGAAANALIWHQVSTAIGTPLTGIKAIRGTVGGLVALTSSGNVYTWGAQTYLGNNSAEGSLSLATQMTLPTGITVKMIGMTANSATTATSYYLLATNGNIYCLGDNANMQLGDWTTTTRLTWVQPLLSAAGSPITNIAWISPNEHGGGTAGLDRSINVLTAAGSLYAWGDNNLQMLGGGAAATINPTLNPGGLAPTDIIVAVATSGHSTLIWKKCVSNFAFVGHRIAGSAADGTSTNNTVGSYNFTSTLNTFAICTEPVIPTLTAGTTTICQGSAVTLTPSPTGGIYSVLSANATLSGNTATITNVDTVQIQYTYTPSGCAVVDTFYQSDYGNLNPGTYPVAGATVLTAANAVWLGANPANTDCVTNTSDNADGFTITNASSGAGTQASPWMLRGGNNYTFQVTVNGGGTAKPVYWAVWYDVNADGDFTDAEDIFQTGTTTHGSPVSTTFSTTIPITGTAAGAASGRIRVLGAAINPTFTKAMNGTGSFVNGEVEDYYVSYLFPLPLTLTNFTVARQNNHAILNWSTSSELNTQSFIIERSTNGNNYVSIGTVAAAGNSNTTLHYNFTDNTTAAVNYYRLKMLDIDGKFTYSEIRLLNFSSEKIIIVYPNPAKDKLTVTGIEAGIQLRLLSNTGQQIISTISTGNTMQLNIKKYPAGGYILQVMSKDEIIKNVKVVRSR